MNILSHSAKVLRANGIDLVAPGLWGGAASAITYDIIVSGPEGDFIIEGVTPQNARPPDSVDTVAALPGSPVGISNPHGSVFSFIIPEMPRMTETCDAP